MQIDISGVPLFYVNKIVTTKMDDGNVLVVCGFKNGTVFTPLYATISPASIAAEDGAQYVEAARSVGEMAH